MINPTNQPHLMHLHGFYFDVMSLGTEAREVSPSHEATEAMAGLILGVTAEPREPAAAEPYAPAERRLRLFANRRAGVFGDRRGFGFVVEEGGREPAPDSVRIPGSPLVLVRGEPTEIAVLNRLDRPLSVHWHGIELESYYDGVAGWSGVPGRGDAAGRIAPAIAPGDSFVVRITPRRAGTFIYHIHNEREHELASGLYGPLLVLEPGGRHDPERDRTFVLSEPGPGSRLGAEGAPFINGSPAPEPVVLRQGVPYRFRFIGIAANDIYVLWIEEGPEGDASGPPGRLGACAALEETGRLASWVPIARDGADRPAPDRRPRPACESRLGPGSTFDYAFTTAVAGRLTLYAQVVDSSSGELGELTSMPVEVRAP